MRILIAEDDTLLADGLTRLMAQSGYDVDLAEDGARADALLQQTPYDLVILDLGLPGMDGLEVLRRLRQRNDQSPVLILTARDGLNDRVRGLDLGADDYLIKPFALPELKARIRALIRRSHPEAKSQIVHGPLVYDAAARRAWAHGKPLELTVREWEVLGYLLSHSGKVVSKEQLIDSLSGLGEELSANAVEVYMSRLRAKLESEGVIIRTVRGFGYLLEEAPDGQNQP